MAAEWRLTWGATNVEFPSGMLDVYSWVSTPLDADGWDRFATVRLTDEN
ncbi:MAG: hypothetical protein HY329_18580 [Chloroflexi bacterium]|nr:hypothetical protein [Chloroflexota bacterium]